MAVCVLTELLTKCVMAVWFDRAVDQVCHGSVV